MCRYSMSEVASQNLFAGLALPDYSGIETPSQEGSAAPSGEAATPADALSDSAGSTSGGAGTGGPLAPTNPGVRPRKPPYGHGSLDVRPQHLWLCWCGSTHACCILHLRCGHDACSPVTLQLAGIKQESGSPLIRFAPCRKCPPTSCPCRSKHCAGDCVHAVRRRGRPWGTLQARGRLPGCAVVGACRSVHQRPEMLPAERVLLSMP